jgi:hypothetical protein
VVGVVPEFVHRSGQTKAPRHSFRIPYGATDPAVKARPGHGFCPGDYFPQDWKADQAGDLEMARPSSAFAEFRGNRRQVASQCLQW